LVTSGPASISPTSFAQQSSMYRARRRRLALSAVSTRIYRVGLDNRWLSGDWPRETPLILDHSSYLQLLFHVFTLSLQLCHHASPSFLDLCFELHIPSAPHELNGGHARTEPSACPGDSLQNALCTQELQYGHVSWRRLASRDDIATATCFHGECE
jgi:hypothetical protein